MPCGSRYRRGPSHSPRRRSRSCVRRTATTRTRRSARRRTSPWLSILCVAKWRTGTGSASSISRIGRRAAFTRCACARMPMASSRANGPPEHSTGPRSHQS
ncbi:hypothetical protein [Caudoviricetes sp.]|nr:hypothetical protein [Caudoviricetes sp.]